MSWVINPDKEGFWFLQQETRDMIPVKVISVNNKLIADLCGVYIPVERIDGVWIKIC